ncbi:MAG: hypothetical protein HQL66_07960 [Magnetococcales bacterium]|nr:hypothetical protein [Magnetococcales bacterium]
MYEPTRIMTRHGKHRKDGSPISVKDPSQNLVECISPFMVRRFVAHVTEEKRWPYDIADICNQFYGGAVLKEQIDMLKAMRMPQWADNLAQGIRDAMAAKSGFLLRVGKHDGADFLTIERYRRINTKHGHKLPISTTVCGMEDGTHVPFAWLFVEIVQEGEKPPPNPLRLTLFGLGKDMFAKGKDRRQQFDSQRQKTLEQRRVIEEKRRVEEDQRRIAEAKRQAEEEERLVEEKKFEDELARMTPQQRQIAMFRRTIREARISQGTNGELWQGAKNLIKAADNWTPEEKSQLRQVLEHELPKKLKGVDKKKIQSLCEGL